MKERSRVEQFEHIRRAAREEGLSVRGLARRYGVRADPDEITRGLWVGFLFADL